MSQENVEVVRRLFEAFQGVWQRGDPGALFDSGLLADDAEWIPFRGWPGPQSYRGRDEFVEFWSTWTEDFEGWSVELERLIDAADEQVVGLFHQTATGRGSGVPVKLHFGMLCELENGRVIRMRNYTDPAEALEAAGLSEDDAST
jgi:ketosteroid isomerase-like protein